MTSGGRLLAGSVVNLSISESDDSSARGFPPWQVNRVTLQIVAALFGQGVSVVFGHDWREDGVMEAIHGFARQMQPPLPLSRADAERVGQPLLRNLLPWPDRPNLSGEDLERLAPTLRVDQAGLPPELRAHGRAAIAEDPRSAIFRYLRARGLTHLRHQLTALSDARLCVGGRTSGSAGRYPGVIEEALIALTSRKPLFLAGLLGGATGQVIAAVEGQRMPDRFCPPTELEATYARPPVDERADATVPDRSVDREQLWAFFQRSGRASIAEKVNGLTPEENAEMFLTPALERVIQLVLTALGRLRARGAIPR